MEPLKPYWRRFWSRFWQESKAWPRDNIIWSFALVLVPPFLLWLKSGRAIDWPLIGMTLICEIAILVVYGLVQLRNTPKRLDDERQARESSLAGTIAKREETIRALQPPKRTPAEQHHYDKARNFLSERGPNYVTAIRHLQAHPKVSFGLYYPQLPTAFNGKLSVEDFRRIYDVCAEHGIVHAQWNPAHTEISFEVSPTMTGVLNELLYDPAITSAAG